MQSFTPKDIATVRADLTEAEAGPHAGTMAVASPSHDASRDSAVSRVAASGRTRLLCAVLHLIGAASPALAARIAERFWFTPPRAPLGSEAAACLAAAERSSILVHGRPVAVWSWGEGPTVLLVHGWGGNAGQMRGLIAPLVASGFRVVAFDAPAHGTSAPSRLGGRRSSLLEFAEALRTVSARLDLVAGLVAHSGGCAAVALAIRDGWTPPVRMAFMAPLVRVDVYAWRFAAAIGLTDRAAARFHARVVGRLRRPLSDFAIAGLPYACAVPPLLLVHDRDDREVPYADSWALAVEWPDTRLLATAGLGHRRLLHDRAVVEQVTAFMGVARETVRTHMRNHCPAGSRGDLDRDYEAAGFTA